MRSSDKTFFALPRLHRLFAAASVLLVAVSVWMVVADHARPWRTYQRTYRERIEPWTTAARLRDAQQRGGQGRGVAALEQQLAAEQPSLAKRLLGLPLIDCLGRPLGVEQIWLPELRIDYHFREVARFDRCTTCHQAIDKALPNAASQAAYPREKVLTLQLGKPRPESSAAGQGGDAVLGAYGFALAQHGMLDEAAPTVELVRDRSPAAVGGLEVGDRLLRIGTRVVRERAVALESLTQHAAAGKPVALEVLRGLAHPYATHPRLDLFVGPNSPHPVGEFGCTICHAGQGSATDFTWAAHAPNSPAQRRDWRRRLGWHYDENWEYPMLPARLAESRCLKCHAQVSELEPSRRYPDPPAAKLLAGYRLVRQLGCFGCHEIQGFDSRGRVIGPDLRLEPAAAGPDNKTPSHPGTMRRVGPSLRNVAGRLDFAYLVEHTSDPARLRPGSRMPRLFGINEHLDGQMLADTARQEEAELAAVAAYLLSASETQTLVPGPAGVTEKPSPTRGARLFRMQGCLACHQHEAMPEGQAVVGPNLSQLGAKYATDAGRAWLASWIRNPAHHAPRTAMPQVPLQAQPADPAADLAAWLTATGTPRPARAWDRAAAALGAATIRKRGCYGCHDIPGFDRVQLIGPALTDWGRKSVSLLAFERVDELVRATTDHSAPFFQEALLDHRREGFLWQKLSAPRSFDYRKEKPFAQQLRMGRFTLTDSEREAIITFVMGLVAQPPTARYVYQPGARQRALVDGRKLIDQYGCAECHTLELERWTLRYDPAKFPAPPASAEFAFLAPHLPGATLAASRTADRRGLAEVQVTGMPRVDAQGQLQEDEDDDGRPVYGFTLWEPAAVAGHVWRVGGPDLLVPQAQLAGRRAPWGGNYARLLYPLVLAEAQASGSSVVPQEAWGWLPPALARIGQAVEPQWMYGYLLRPTVIRPAAVLRMPQFNLTPDEARRLADYIAALGGAEFPYAAPATTQPATAAEAQARLARFDRARKFLVDRTTYCAKCHQIGVLSPGGENRTILAPALDQVGRRLRPDYLRRWLANPKSALPYTAMPVNFPPDGAPLGQDIYRGTSLEQLDAVWELLLNYDWYLGQKVGN
jgi:cbb3-type cytochrome oxidase cytochrome c subunit